MNTNQRNFPLVFIFWKRVDIKVDLGKFNELEDKIKSIVSEQDFLKKQCQILEEALKNKESEIEEFKSKLKALDEERNSVRGRVDSLLDLLADIEVAK
jgi:septal ring factor EnvC (AmiA/AmiB activator)